MKKKVFKAAPGDEGTTLVAFVGRELSAPQKEVERLIQRGAVYLQGRRAQKSELPLRAGDLVAIVLEERGRSSAASPPPQVPPILYEDDELVAFDKPAGIAAQPTPSGVGESLLDLASRHLGRPARLVHRIDKETSGVMLFAKSQRAMSKLNDQFRSRGVRKQYAAVTGPALPDVRTVDRPIGKDPSRVGAYRVVQTGSGRPAITELTRVHAAFDHCLVLLFPRTGRTHQLRVHLAWLEAPIAGDRLYRGPTKIAGRTVGRTLLHALTLTIAHPKTARDLTIRSPLPEDLASIWSLSGYPLP